MSRSQAIGVTPVVGSGTSKASSAAAWVVVRAPPTASMARLRARARPARADPLDAGRRGQDHPSLTQPFHHGLDDGQPIVGRPRGLGGQLDGHPEVAGLEPAQAEVGRDLPAVLQSCLGPLAILREQPVRRPELVGKVADERLGRRRIGAEPEPRMT